MTNIITTDFFSCLCCFEGGRRFNDRSLALPLPLEGTTDCLHLHSYPHPGPTLFHEHLPHSSAKTTPLSILHSCTLHHLPRLPLAIPRNLRRVLTGTLSPLSTLYASSPMASKPLSQPPSRQALTRNPYWARNISTSCLSSQAYLS